MIRNHMLYYWALLMPTVLAFAERKVSTEQDQIDSKLDGIPRIVGGQEAPEGRYPYAVSLVYPGGSLKCGGSLIAPNIVLSAAHCVADITHVQIGRQDRNDLSDEYEEFSILHKLVHPLYEYDDDSFSYDQMLVVMDGESTATPIRINRDPTIPADGSQVIAVGWGVTDADNDNVSPVLMEVSVFVESNSECEQAYSYNESYRGLITPDMLCAADVGKDSCFGDSGGPLILVGLNRRDLLVGVVSWGFWCADPDFPGVYSRTSFDSDWIDSNVCLHSKNNTPSDFSCETSRLDGPFLTLQIQFDEYPEEVGWMLTSSVTTGESRMDNIIASRTPPYYGPALVNQLLTEIIPVPAINASYTFIVSDSHGDGLCCAYGHGWYSLWKGPVEDNELLASGDASDSFQEETDFTVSFASTTTTIAPTTTTSSAASTILSLKRAFGLLAATTGCALWVELDKLA